MGLTIDGVPDHLTREEYRAAITDLGFDPGSLVELRWAPDGVHAVVVALDEHGTPLVERRVGRGAEVARHRVYIPVRDDDTDTRTTRVTPVGSR